MWLSDYSQVPELLGYFYTFWFHHVEISALFIHKLPLPPVKGLSKHHKIYSTPCYVYGSQISESLLVKDM
uniref:Uncharacterized protein n=1 Tax=Anguilla anguilla TaxID=7936 RepID=A0A0E9X1H0_ANGAN